VEIAVSVGYSGKPLYEKLGIRPDMSIFVIDAPADYERLLESPQAIRFASARQQDLDLIHIFATTRAALTKALNASLKRIQPAGMIWVSWPKKSANVKTDLTEDVIRDVALPLGLVDVKVCAVSDVWSGLKLVIRKENRRVGH
jgi:hypothetical protein